MTKSTSTNQARQVVPITERRHQRGPSHRRTEAGTRRRPPRATCGTSESNRLIVAGMISSSRATIASLIASSSRGSNASRSTGMIGSRSVAGSKSSTPVYKPIARDLLSSSPRFLAPSVLRWARPPCCPGVDVRFQKRRSTKAATKQNFGGWSLTSRSPARRYKPRRGGRSQGVNLRFMTRRKTIVAKCISATANRHSGATTNRF